MRIPAVLLLSALAHHHRARLHDGAGHDGAIFFEDLGHADLATEYAGILVHFRASCWALRGRFVNGKLAVVKSCGDAGIRENDGAPELQSTAG